VASASTPATPSASTIITSVPPGYTLYNTTLFVDVVGIANYTSAQSGVGEKAGLIRVPLGGDGWYGDPYYYYGWGK
jgi:hypothetical protein